MPAIIFLLPLIVIIVYAMKRPTPGWLFLSIYLPALLLVPDTFHTTTGGIPKLSVNQAIIMAIFPIVLLRYARYWKPSLMDVAVFMLVVLMTISEYLAAGYKEAQNLCFGSIAAIFAPYLVARLCIGQENLHLACARRVVILMFAMVMISLYEFKFGYNPFLAWFGRLFPGQGTGWVTTFRHGFARVAGPYSHAILAGIMIAIAYRLQRWLQWGQYWEPKFARFPGLPFSKAQCITAILLLGCIMTIARGPWLGAIAGSVVLVIAHASNRRRSLLIIGSLMLIVLPIAYLGFQTYLDVKPGMAMTTSQESAIYRKVLMDKYIAIALDHALLGWGRNTWPKVPGMGSIDNYFLLLSLMHGLAACGTLLFMFGWQIIRLMRHGMQEAPIKPGQPERLSLAFTHVGILIMILVSLVTVYLGEQVVPMLFIIFGWGEAVLQGRKQVAEVPQARQEQGGRGGRGFRVMT